MSNDANQNSQVISKEKRNFSRYVIPILGGAIIWVGLLSVGIKVLQGITQSKSTSQQENQTKTDATVKPVVNAEPAQGGTSVGTSVGTTNEGTSPETTTGVAGTTTGVAGTTNGTAEATSGVAGATSEASNATSPAADQPTSAQSPQNDTVANSRYALQMQDDREQLYSVYLYASNESSAIHAGVETAAAMPGDTLYRGDYETYVGPVDGSSVQKQSLTLPHYTFNGTRRQAYVVNGNAQLLVVTQTVDYNGVTGRFFTLKSGNLVPVPLLMGKSSKQDLYMVSMRAAQNNAHQFQTISYDKSSAQYWLTTWQYDPAATVLRKIGQSDLSASRE